MKFTDGIWLVKEGYQINSPQEVFDYKVEENSLKLFAPFKKVETRGNTLNLGMMTVDISSPREDVLQILRTGKPIAFRHGMIVRSNAVSCHKIVRF